MPRLIIDTRNPDVVTYLAHQVHLRPAEYRLLLALARRPAQVVPWASLYTSVYPAETLVEPGQLYSHASRLRRALAQAPVTPIVVETVRPYGLRLALRPDDIAIIA